MNLSEISNKYKENLDNFFSNEDVIEIIYRKQYGDKYYEENELECKKEFKTSQEMWKQLYTLCYVCEHCRIFLYKSRVGFVQGIAQSIAYSRDLGYFI